MIGEKIYFNPSEVRAIALGISRIIDDVDAMKKGHNAEIPWTPEARKIQKEIEAAARSAAAKLEKFTGYKVRLDPYVEGDEDEFLTKPS